MFHYKTQQFVSPHCSTAVKVMFTLHPVLISSGNLPINLLDIRQTQIEKGV